MTLSEKISALRKQKGWSQEELAEKLMVTRQAVSKWESAQSMPDLDKLVQLSEARGVSTDYLLLDVSNSADKNLSGIFHAIDHAKDEQYKRLYAVIKILAENIDKL